MNGSSPLRAEPQLALYLNYHTQNFGEVSAVREFLPGKSTIPCLRKEIPEVWQKPSCKSMRRKDIRPSFDVRMVDSTPSHWSTSDLQAMTVDEPVFWTRGVLSVCRKHVQAQHTSKTTTETTTVPTVQGVLFAGLGDTEWSSYTWCRAAYNDANLGVQGNEGPGASTHQWSNASHRGPNDGANNGRA